jgi:predicted TIM-barrel fold metal-dependent hydrolase
MMAGALTEASMSEIDRRGFLMRAAAVMAAAAGSEAHGLAVVAQTAERTVRRIDIHHHFAPPAWVAEARGRPLLQTANITWTPEKSIEDLDRAGSAAAVISITNPGLWFGDAAATARLARACNDYGARLVQQYPARFGLFASMPLPDVDATLKEIAYAYDVLKADGIGLFTSYGDKWLGNPTFRPVMEELNRRRATVHVHPTAANCCRNLDYGVAPGSIEYGTDTTRAIVGVAFSGDSTRYPAITFIWSHAGGSMPFLAGRIDGASSTAKDRMPAGFVAEAKKFHYDTAGAVNRGALVSLIDLVSSSHVLFGTDFPPGGTNRAVASALADLKLFGEKDLQAIERDNAVRLLPRLNR